MRTREDLVDIGAWSPVASVAQRMALQGWFVGTKVGSQAGSKKREGPKRARQPIVSDSPQPPS
jgi:hypothetical protein